MTYNLDILPHINGHVIEWLEDGAIFWSPNPAPTNLLLYDNYIFYNNKYGIRVPMNIRHWEREATWGLTMELNLHLLETEQWDRVYYLQGEYTYPSSEGLYTYKSRPVLYSLDLLDLNHRMPDGTPLRGRLIRLDGTSFIIREEDARLWTFIHEEVRDLERL